MPPALRKGPFSLACAAATSASAHQRSESEHTIRALADHWLRPLAGSGR